MLHLILVMTAILVAASAAGRIFFGSARDFFRKRKLIRIHHGYVGLLFCLVYLAVPEKSLLVMGLPLLMSDAIHHFIVLPIWIGRTEFP